MHRTIIRFCCFLLLILQTGCLQSPPNPVKEERLSQSLPIENEKEKNMTQLNTTFIQLAEQGQIDEMAELLNNGADINTTDERGRTAAMIAVHTNQLELFQWLIDHGADINIRDQRLDNPLLYSGAEGRIEFLRAAIKANADTRITNRFGGTALIPAADRGHVEIVEELLNYSDVYVDHINNLGWTALLEAIILGDGGKRHQQIVSLLIEYGADIEIADSQGVTPLEHAKQLGYFQIVELLEKAKVQ